MGGANFLLLLGMKKMLLFLMLGGIILMTGCDPAPDLSQGHLLLESEQYEQALPVYQSLVQSHPNSRGAWVGKGIAHYHLGQGDSAWASFEKAYPLPTEETDPYARAGAASYYMGLLAYGWFADFAMAESHFQDAVMANYENSNTFTYLGLCVVNENPVKALEYYNKAVQADLENTFARENRAYLLATMGIYQDALADYDFLIGKNPDDKDNWGNRGYCYIGQEKWTEAMQDFSKALEIDSNYVDGIMYMGVCHLSLGEAEKALEYFNQGVTMAPQYGRMYYYQGFAYMALEQMEASCEALTMAEQYGNMDGIRIREEVCK